MGKRPFSRGVLPLMRLTGMMVDGDKDIHIDDNVHRKNVKMPYFIAHFAATERICHNDSGL